MDNSTDKSLIDGLIALIDALVKAAQDNPKKARKYNQASSRVQQALGLLGGSYRRKLNRPPSIGLPIHELKPAEEQTREPIKVTGDILADNLEEWEEDEF